MAHLLFFLLDVSSIYCMWKWEQSFSLADWSDRNSSESA